MKLRPTAKLDESFSRRLAAYATGAGAAGMGVLAMAPAAHADIIYTPAHISVTGGTSVIVLDLNHDGIRDFNLELIYFDWSDVQVDGQRASNGVLRGGGASRYWAAALRAGAPIGPEGQFLRTAFLASVPYSATGPWVDVTGRFLGLRFMVDGQDHYGWLQLNVTICLLGSPGCFPGNQITETLTGYAYDTIPNQGLLAGQTQTPEPGTLGLLALGSLGLALWRRRKAVASQQ